MKSNLDPDRDIIIEFIKCYQQNQHLTPEQFLKSYPTPSCETKKFLTLVEQALSNSKQPLEKESRSEHARMNYKQASNPIAWTRYILMGAVILSVCFWAGYYGLSLKNFWLASDQHKTTTNKSKLISNSRPAQQNTEHSDVVIRLVSSPEEAQDVAENAKLEEMYLRCPSFENGHIEFRFTQDISAEIFFKNLQITPAVANLNVQQITPQTVKIVGNFIPGENYSLEFVTGPITADGKTKLEGFDKSIQFPQRNPTLRFAQAGNILNLYGQYQIAMEMVNCPSIDVEISQIYPNNLLHFLYQNSYEYLVSDYAKLLTSQTIPGSKLKNQPETIKLDLKTLLNHDMKSGAYFVQIHRKSLHNGERYYYNTDENRLILVSDLGMTVKKSNTELLCWLTSLSKALPLSQVKISVWTSKNQEIATGITDQQGIAKIAIPPSVDGDLFLVQAILENDTNVLEFGQGRWNATRFATDGFSTNINNYRSFIYSNRNIYLPGETAYFAALVRDAQRMIPPSFPSTWVIQRHDGLEMLRQSMLHDNQGSLAVNWAIPAQARTGSYQIWLETAGQKEKLANYSFQVEECVPDRFRVEVTIPEKDYQLGDKMPLTCVAKQLQGTPAAGRRVTMQTSLVPVPLTLKTYPEYTFGDPENYIAPINLPSEEKICNDQGEANFEVQLPKELKSATMLHIQSKVTLHDFAGRSTTKTCVVPFYPHPTYLGTQVMNTPQINVGQPVQFSIVACDAKGNAKNLSQVQVQISRSTWVWNRRYQNNRVSYDYSEISEVLKNDTISVDGQTVYSYNVERYGQYRLTLKTNNGPTTMMRFSTWSGSEFQFAGNREYLELSSDLKQYPAGAKAKIAIRSPFDGMALVCLEREQIFETQVVEVKNNIAEVQFDLTETHYPNVYCTASVVRSQMTDSPEQLYRAYGILPITLDVPNKLAVHLESPSKTRPETTVEVQCTVKWGDQPLANTLVTLAAVDEGVCQLTNFASPDPFQFFYGKESLQVNSQDIYRKLISETPPGGKNAPSSRSSSPITNPLSRPKIVSMWFPHLCTDANGQIKLNLKVPKYIGELRLMAIAAHKNQFGSSQKALTVNAPLTVRLNGPRFAAWNDRFQVTATVLYQPDMVAPSETSPQPLMGKIEWDGTPGIRLMQDELMPTCPLTPGQETVLRFPVECTMPKNFSQIVYNAKMTITATVGTETYQETLELPIRCHLPPQQNEQSGVLELGTTQTLRSPVSLTPLQGKGTLWLSNQPMMQFTTSLDYLLQYPYGCVEQTTSGAFPLLYLENLLKLRQDTLPSKDIENQLEEEMFSHHFSLDNEVVVKNSPSIATSYVTAGIQRLATMQVRSGGFSMWPGGHEAHPWGSCYAAHFLVEAKKAGYSIPVPVWNGMMEWLQRTASRSSDGMQEHEIRAYSSYILALEGKLQYSDLSWFIENRIRLNTLTRQMVAGALLKLGHRNKAARMLESTPLSHNDPDNDYTSDHNFNTPARNHAFYISILLDNDPNDPEVAEMIEALVRQIRHNGRWGNTQENAFALMALGKYAKFMAPNVDQNAHVILAQNDENIELWKPDRLPPFEFDELPSELQLIGQGHGKVFYRYITETIPHNITLPPESNSGLYIQRVFLNPKGIVSSYPDETLAPAGESDPLSPDSTTTTANATDVSSSRTDSTTSPDTLSPSDTDNNQDTITADDPNVLVEADEDDLASEEFTIPTFQVRHGSLVWVEFQIRGDYTLRHLALEQWLPAGMEIENIRLANTVQLPDEIRRRNNITPEYQDIRTDRTNIFLHLPSPNRTYRVQCALRAICPGTYTFPGPRIHAMYDENIRSQGQDAIIHIVE